MRGSGGQQEGGGRGRRVRSRSAKSCLLVTKRSGRVRVRSTSSDRAGPRQASHTAHTKLSHVTHKRAKYRVPHIHITCSALNKLFIAFALLMTNLLLYQLFETTKEFYIIPLKAIISCRRRSDVVSLYADRQRPSRRRSVAIAQT